MEWLVMVLPDLTEKRDGNHDDDDDVRWWGGWVVLRDQCGNKAVSPEQ